MSDARGPVQNKPEAKQPLKRHKWRRRIVVVGVVFLLLTIGAELVARYWFVFGDPVQYVADAEIEYLMRPSMKYRRMGGEFKVNAYSMRSDDFPATKTDPRELRVMVIGDSVVNGNSPVGQNQLGTSLLKERLSSELGRPLVTGNISAGSWGPGNMLAYLRRFGLFDADVVIIVLSSHDATDAPTFEPMVDVDPNLPSHKPVLALQEAVFRYLPRYLPAWLKRSPPPTPLKIPPSSPLEDLRAMIRRCRTAGIPVAMVQHLERHEVESVPDSGHALVKAIADAEGVPVVQLGPSLHAAMASGKSPYQDTIHLNVHGQQLLADALHQAVMTVLPREVSNKKSDNDRRTN